MHALITRYNGLNGQKINVDALKQLHKEARAHLTGPHADVFKTIHDRTRSALKFAKTNGHSIIRLQVEPVSIPKEEKPKASPPPRKKQVRRTKVIVKPEVKDTPPKEEIKKPLAAPTLSRSELDALGFVSADKTPEKVETFYLPGAMGALLGARQRYKNMIVIAGETASSKSQLGMQIANAYGEMGDEVAWLDYEQGGLQSKDTQLMLSRNTTPAGKSRIKIKGDYPKTLEAIIELGKKVKVVAIDSGSVLRLRSNSWIEELREACPHTDWIVMMQLTGDGTTRGGTSAEFDSPTVIKTYRLDKNDPMKNMAVVEKNRGNKTGIKYQINTKKFLK